MTRMPTFEEIRADFEAGVRAAEQRIEHPFRRAASAAPEPPAAGPVNLTAAPAAAATRRRTMSLATIEADLGQRIHAAEQAVHDEIGKLVADLPVLTADAKRLAGNPFTQVALKAAEHLAAGVLPADAIATVAGNALTWLDDLAKLYNPAPAAQGAQQAPAQAPAPQQGAPAQ